MTPITFPFPVTVYGQSYTAGTASSNGNLQIGTSNGAYSNECLPTSMFGRCSRRTGMTSTQVGHPRGSHRSHGLAAEPAVHHRVANPLLLGPRTANFEIIFTEGSGIIRYRYGVERDGGLSATIGIQENRRRRISSRATPHR